MSKQRKWTIADLKYIKANLTKSNKELAQHFGVTASIIGSLMHYHGISKKGIPINNPTKFKKGNIPHSKGKKRTEYMSIENHMKISKALVERKSYRPKRPIGEVYWYPSDERMCIKLESDRRANYAKYVWEQHFGVKLDRNVSMIHLDGNKRNCDISNLKPETPTERINRVVNEKGKNNNGGKRKGTAKRMNISYTFHNPYKLTA